MSLKSEVAELIDWLSERTTVEPSGATPTPLPRQDWHLVQDNLENAVGFFGSAGDLVAKQPGQSAKSVLADLAFDLANETQMLADRAYVMSRRAMPRAAKSADERAKEPAAKSAANKRPKTS